MELPGLSQPKAFSWYKLQQVMHGLPLTKNYFVLFQSPTIFIPFLDTFIVFTGFGFVAGMLEPYMKKIVGATQAEVGTAFLLEGVAYTVTSLAAGLVIHY